MIIKVAKGSAVILIFLSIMILLAGVVMDKSVADDENYKEVNTTELSNHKKEDATELIIPTKEQILSHGYPVNENGQTYGPDWGHLLEDETQPDLLLAIGENGVQGYMYPPEGISSPSELADYTPPKSTPLYLHDGETVIGTFNFY